MGKDDARWTYFCCDVKLKAFFGFFILFLLIVDLANLLSRLDRSPPRYLLLPLHLFRRPFRRPALP